MMAQQEQRTERLQGPTVARDLSRSGDRAGRGQGDQSRNQRTAGEQPASPVPTSGAQG
jgi:hypothetical protein